MALNFRDIIVWDSETTGLIPGYHEIIQLAARAYNCRTLEPYSVQDGGEFKATLLKPLHFDRIEPKALQKNRITVEELQKAPEQAVVWNQFIDWVGRFNLKGSDYMAPIAAGKNIDNFDMKFIPFMNELHCPKKDKTVLFNKYMTLDLDRFLFAWFENSREPSNFKMETVLEYFGVEATNLHQADTDVFFCGLVLMRFLKMHRTFREKVRFKGSMREKREVVSA